MGWELGTQNTLGCTFISPSAYTMETLQTVSEIIVQGSTRLPSRIIQPHGFDPLCRIQAWLQNENELAEIQSLPSRDIYVSTPYGRSRPPGHTAPGTIPKPVETSGQALQMVSLVCTPRYTDMLLSPPHVSRGFLKHGMSQALELRFPGSFPCIQ